MTTEAILTHYRPVTNSRTNLNKQTGKKMAKECLLIFRDFKMVGIKKQFCYFGFSLLRVTQMV